MALTASSRKLRKRGGNGATPASSKPRCVTSERAQKNAFGIPTDDIHATRNTKIVGRSVMIKSVAQVKNT